MCWVVLRGDLRSDESSPRTILYRASGGRGEFTKPRYIYSAPPGQREKEGGGGRRMFLCAGVRVDHLFCRGGGAYLRVFFGEIYDEKALMVYIILSIYVYM